MKKNNKKIKTKKKATTVTRLTIGNRKLLWTEIPIKNVFETPIKCYCHRFFSHIINHNPNERIIDNYLMARITIVQNSYFNKNMKLFFRSNLLKSNDEFTSQI